MSSGSFLASGEKTNPTVKKEHVISVVEEITGIILDSENKSQKDKIFERLSSVVAGQRTAVEKISNAVTRSYAGINSPDRPRGVFLFLGESGVGKTALATALTKELFGSNDLLIRYDMSEYCEGAAVTKLLGAAPGYVGYDENNAPIEKIRKHPYSVVLLDEIEKAHPDVLSLFLQVFDNGFLTDATGRKISFRNTYIIMTSNVGSGNFLEGKSSGFIQDKGDKAVYDKLRSYFKDEFINRIDEIVVFDRLDISALKDIAKMKIEQLKARLNSIGINVEIDERIYCVLAKNTLLQKGSGARPLDRLITTLIENKIATMIVEGVVKKGDSISVVASDSDILCIKKMLALK